MSDKFDATKYKNDFAKAHYKKFVADIKPELWEDITAYCKDLNISKPEFLRRAIEALKSQ